MNDVPKTLSVDGKTYRSPEAMPPDVRALHDQAVAAKGSAPAPATQLKFSTKLNFDGVEYDSPDSMPPDVRRVYDDAVALISMQDLASTTLKGEQAMRDEIARRAGGHRSTGRRFVWIVIGLLAFFLALILFKI
jgi:hypothetical protein